MMDPAWLGLVRLGLSLSGDSERLGFTLSAYISS